ncbi:MAG: oligosaccharide flippase family protein [Candidatus Cloacimonadota bacterium]|nr:oligosaccharide flippase family protein [Candidatus Cloacimonadota bacterium]
MNKLIKKIFVYTAGSLFNKIILLLFLPIFTSYMIPSEYAVYANLMIFISFAGLIYLMGMQQAIFSFFYQKKSKEHYYLIISTIYIIILIVGIILSALVILFRVELSDLVVKSTAYSHLFIFISIILLCDALAGISLSFLNIMEKSRQFVILSTIRNLVFLALLSQAAFTHNFSLELVFVFMLISAAVSFISAIFLIQKLKAGFELNDSEKKYFSPTLLKNLLSFGIIMVPGTIAMMILRVSDRYMLTYLSAGSLHDVGIYAIGYKIGMIITFVNAITSRVFFPYAMKIQNRPDAKKIYKKIFKYYLLFAGFLGILIITFTNEIFSVVIDGAYFQATKIVVFAVISNLLLGVFNIINLSFYVKQKATNITVAVAVGAFFNIAMNFFLIPKFGIYGASISSVISYLFIVLFNYFFAQKVYQVKYNLGYLFILIFVMILSSGFVYLTSVNPTNFLIKCFFILVVFSSLIYYIYKNKEFEFIRNAFVSIRS